MKESCGCCEGIEVITPVSTDNRPGLNALVYRVGTHATFLETMLARLSSHTLRVETEAGEHQLARPLQSLTTRETTDASIALLDAWATVADVLTFYQERIANEGYLRTATERRSVLELARLLGYQPRPGVSASVYLAYTLEDDKGATIPAGSKAQSVAGPGELPQIFETAEDIEARGEWNLLQPRLTRPQAMRAPVLLGGEPLYLKGTATNLKLNDPLLIDLGSASAGLFRVTKVEAVQAADHTLVTVQPWLQEPPAAPPTAHVAEASVNVSAASQVAEVGQIIERYMRAEDFGVNAATQTARRVLDHLENLQSKLNSGLTAGGLRGLLEEVLPPLREEHSLASEGNFTKLEPWIGGIVSEFEEISQKLASTGSASSGVVSGINMAGTASGATLGTGQSTVQSSLTSLTPLLGSLEKPAVRQPASRQQLGTSLADTFSESSDALPQLLAALRPSLRPLLYGAWGNVPITEPTPARVYALRARASAFGHNAPLKTVPDTADTTGFKTKQEEWTLFRTSGQLPLEHFTINFNFSLTGSSGSEFREPQITTTVDIAPPTPAAHGTASHRVWDTTPFTINLPTANNEVVTVTLSNQTDNPSLQLRVRLQFSVRQITIIAERNIAGLWRVTSDGSDPTIFNIRPNAADEPAQGNDVTIEGDLESAAGLAPTEIADRVSLDASYNQILPGSWAVLERPYPFGSEPSPLVITQVKRVTEASRADYGMTGKGTQLELRDPWIAPVPNGDDFSVIRGTSIFAQSELLELAEEPLDPIAEELCGDRIELANLISGLEPGRWLIVSGERTDIRPAEDSNGTNGGTSNGSSTTGSSATAGGNTTGSNAAAPAGGTTAGALDETIISGIRTAELVMLSGVEQGYDARVPGDKTHSTLLLAKELAYCYKLDTVRVYGNVSRATHGETRNDILGSGDASKAMQSFTLNQSPLTYISAPTTSGIESTLKVRVQEILWHETDTLAGLGPKDHSYVTKTDDESKTTIIFGNGKAGARLPTGAENVKATYRVGIGAGGNVKAEQISVAMTKPLGVKEVINPLAASGGADRESRDEARRNAPLAVMALDRLVSTQDYEDFARTFAGVGKASATRLSDGRRQLVYLTIAGAEDIPIAPDSDLLKNLGEALRKYGDPYQPVQIATRFLKVLFASAKVRVHPDYLWEYVEPKIRAAMLDYFSFDRRQLGQDVVLSEVIGTIQGVEGVVYVDVDTLDDVKEDITAEEMLELSGGLRLRQRIPVYLARVDKTALDPEARLRPAQLALFTPLVPATLNLTELKG